MDRNRPAGHFTVCEATDTPEGECFNPTDHVSEVCDSCRTRRRMAENTEAIKSIHAQWADTIT